MKRIIIISAIIFCLLIIFLAGKQFVGKSFYNKGLVQLDSLNYNQAITEFNKALKWKKKFPAALVKRAYSYIQTNQYNQAVEDCDQALKLRLDFTEANFQRGIAYFKLNNLDTARIDFNTCLDNNYEPVESHT